MVCFLSWSNDLLDLQFSVPPLCMPLQTLQPLLLASRLCRYLPHDSLLLLSPLYYAFFCSPTTRFFYLTSISVLGALAIIALLSPALSAPQFRSLRTSLFLTMAFLGVIPATHAVVLHRSNPYIFVAIGYELAMAFLYVTGAAFYISRMPERWMPGAFDIAGHSHQIFHVFVVLGALAHSIATLVMLDFRRLSPTCANLSKFIGTRQIFIS